MLLFRSEEHMNRWYQRQGIPMGAILTLEQQWELARLWYSDRMSAEWRRRTPEEAESVFTSLGLTGEFWRLTGGRYLEGGTDR
jgi:Alkylmercury lyase